MHTAEQFCLRARLRLVDEDGGDGRCSRNAHRCEGRRDRERTSDAGAAHEDRKVGGIGAEVGNRAEAVGRANREDGGAVGIPGGRSYGLLRVHDEAEVESSASREVCGVFPHPQVVTGGRDRLACRERNLVVDLRGPEAGGDERNADGHLDGKAEVEGIDRRRIAGRERVGLVVAREDRAPVAGDAESEGRRVGEGRLRTVDREGDERTGEHSNRGNDRGPAWGSQHDDDSGLAKNARGQARSRAVSDA